MEYLVTTSEMKRCDYNTINKIGMPSMVLVERAALATMEELYDKMFDLRRVLVVCGKGNNGADGFALARLLHLKGIDVDILFIDDEDKSTRETRQQIRIAKNYGIKISDNMNFQEYTTIVDALLGVGLSRDVEGQYGEIIKEINSSKALILSVDIPSGISADNGKILGRAIKADKTVTFAFNKLGLVLYPGAYNAGIIKVKDIGITKAGFEGDYPRVYSYNLEDLKMIPKRKEYSNKGSFGKVFLIAGSVNMSGAAFLSAKAAYRMGVGLVDIYTVEENREILQSLLPEAILTSYDLNKIEEKILISKILESKAIIIGPGMGREKSTKDILEIVLSNAKSPIIIDADGINIIAENPQLLDNHNKDIIMTPHLGEMSRLIGKDTREISENIINTAKEFASEKDLICVLKDTRTVVASKGKEVYLNQSGNDAMATAGSGDVLTGIIGGLLAQGLDSREAATLGVYIHGLLGEKASCELGRYAVMAEDIITYISHIVR
ncbi:MAG TPA: NAD(P)H-hydrate dehydratase [Tissierellaceae bacterium]|nr:NAD(P)H-hydrate dehydratase [Tissierellaceae bacterium]